MAQHPMADTMPPQQDVGQQDPSPKLFFLPWEEKGFSPKPFSPMQTQTQCLKRQLAPKGQASPKYPNFLRYPWEPGSTAAIIQLTGPVPHHPKQEPMRKQKEHPQGGTKRRT